MNWHSPVCKITPQKVKEYIFGSYFPNDLKEMLIDYYWLKYGENLRCLDQTNAQPSSTGLPTGMPITW